MKINCCIRFSIFAFALIFLASLSLEATTPTPQEIITTTPEQKNVENKDNSSESTELKNISQTNNQGEQQRKEEQKKKEAAAQDQLQLGKTYEEADQFKEAEAAYIKALESEQTRAEALEGIKRILQKRESFFQKYFWSPLKTSSTTFLPAILPVLLLIGVYFLLKNPADKFGKWRGQNKLMIGKFTDTTERKFGENIVEIFTATRMLMTEHYKPRALITKGIKMPYLLKSQTSRLVEIVESFAPKGWGKMISWLTEKLMQAEFTVRGTIQSSETHLDVFVILSRREEILRTWSRQMSISGAPVLLDEQKDLAYEVLMYLKEYFENEHAY
jgi:hypothetical protein